MAAQLRVDADLADVRQQFERTANSVDELSDQLDHAEDEAARLGHQYQQTGMRMQRLQGEVRQTDEQIERLQWTMRTLGNVMSQADRTAMRDELRRLERQSRETHREIGRLGPEMQRLGRDADDADLEVRRLALALDDAGDEARRLNRELSRLDADAGRGVRQVQRAMLGMAQGARGALAGLSGGVSDAFAAMPAEVKGAAILAGAAVAAVFAAAAGAAIGALIVTAVGGGVIAAGAAIAAKTSAQVQGAFTTLFDRVKSDAVRFAADFEEPLVQSAEAFGATWENVRFAVMKAFSAMAGYVEPLAIGLGNMIERMMPGFNAAIAAAGPVLRELGRSLPVLGAAISHMLSSIAGSGEGLVKGLRVLVWGLSGAFVALGATINVLANAFDWLTDKAGALSSALSQIPVVGKAFSVQAEALDKLNNSAQGSMRSIGGAGLSSNLTAGGFDRLSASARAAATAAKELSDQLGMLIGSQLAVDQASLASKQALDAVRESLKENGRATDAHTAKGQANIQAVLGAVGAYEQERQAAVALAEAQGGNAAAVDAANGKFRAQIGELEAVLRKAGFTEDQINQLLGSYKALANAPNITKTITIKGVTIGDGVSDYSGLHRAFSQYAGGTDSAPPGWAWVGEQGPELMRMRGGEQVISARESARLMAGGGPTGGGYSTGGGGGPMVAQLVSAPGGDSAVAELLSTLVRRGLLRLEVRQAGARVGVVTA